MKKGIFEGLKVVEYGNLVSAPYCTKLLAGLGAEVIKVEKPGVGDEARSHGPFPDDIPHPEKSGLFLTLNTNKLGITLDPETDAGRGVLRRLLSDADVFVENNPPRFMAEHGLSYESLREINPRLVVASITPFGQYGPYKDYKAYDINCAATGGVSVGIGHPDREPLALPLSQGGYQAGIAAASGIVIALLAREKMGEGQHVDIGEVDVWAGFHTGTYILTFLYTGVTGIRRGSHGGYFIYPAEVFPCKDGYVLVNCPQLAQWVRLMELMGNPEWTKNPRYRDRRAMHEQYPDEVNELLIPWFKEHTSQELLEMAMEKRIPLAPIYTTADLVNHPHLKERGFFVEIDHPEAGKLIYPEGPFQSSESHWENETAAPLLGQHNGQILGERLGYSKEQMEEFGRAKVI